MSEWISRAAIVATALVCVPSCSSSVLEEPPVPEQLRRDGVIPARSAAATPNQIDLSSHYTASLDDDWLVSAGANLEPLPKGLQTFGGTTFDVRGLIQLSGTKELQAAGYQSGDPHPYYPDAVNGIAVGATAQRIHFFHASSWSDDDGVEIGDYVVHYADGTTATIPILYLRALRDWWLEPGGAMPTDAAVAWTGQNGATAKRGFQVVLFDYEWTNPQPGVSIDAMDFVSAQAAASPFLIAVTLDPPP
jgi:hypothetical protein